MTAQTAAPPSQIRRQLAPMARRRARQWQRDHVLHRSQIPGVDPVRPIPDPHRYAQNALEIMLLGIDPVDAEGIDPYAL